MNTDKWSSNELNINYQGLLNEYDSLRNDKMCFFFTNLW